MSTIPALDALQSPLSMSGLEAGSPVQPTFHDGQQFETQLASVEQTPALMHEPVGRTQANERGEIVNPTTYDDVNAHLETLGNKLLDLSYKAPSSNGSVQPAFFSPSDGIALGHQPHESTASHHPSKKMEEFWVDAMHEQEKIYNNAITIEFVSNASQSLVKSLKSLLTQGGG